MDFIPASPRHFARDEWDAAHECARSDRRRDRSLLHAYLHRVEGGLVNALLATADT